MAEIVDIRGPEGPGGTRVDQSGPGNLVINQNKRGPEGPERTRGTGDCDG